MLEPEMEEFLHRLVPHFDEQCVGATAEEIRRVEELAGRPLPGFYEWFLMTMGRSMGRLAIGFPDFSVDTVFAAYEEGLVAADPRLLLIARGTYEMHEELYVYDLDEPTREDALVLSGLNGPGNWWRVYETLRERIAYGVLMAHRINRCRHSCAGEFRDDEGDVTTKTDRALRDLGFARSVASGPFCQPFERTDAAIACLTTGHAEDSRERILFRLGGANEASLRGLLGEIAANTRLDIKIKRWYEPNT